MFTTKYVCQATVYSNSYEYGKLYQNLETKLKTLFNNFNNYLRENSINIVYTFGINKYYAVEVEKTFRSNYIIPLVMEELEAKFLQKFRDNVNSSKSSSGDLYVDSGYKEPSTYIDNRSERPGWDFADQTPYKDYGKFKHEG